MKKFIAITLSAVMLSSSIVSANDIGVQLNGEAVEFKTQAPVISNGRTLIPLRSIFEKLGYTINWNADTKTAVLTNDTTTIEVTVNSYDIVANGEVIKSDVPAQIINNTMMLPLRAVTELSGAEVNWDNASKTVFITYDKSSPVTDTDADAKTEDKDNTENTNTDSTTDKTPETDAPAKDALTEEDLQIQKEALDFMSLTNFCSYFSSNIMLKKENYMYSGYITKLAPKNMQNSAEFLEMERIAQTFSDAKKEEVIQSLREICAEYKNIYEQITVLDGYDKLRETALEETKRCEQFCNELDKYIKYKYTYSEWEVVVNKFNAQSDTKKAIATEELEKYTEEKKDFMTKYSNEKEVSDYDQNKARDLMRQITKLEADLKLDEGSSEANQNPSDSKLRKILENDIAALDKLIADIDTIEVHGIPIAYKTMYISYYTDYKNYINLLIDDIGNDEPSGRVTIEKQKLNDIYSTIQEISYTFRF